MRPTRVRPSRGTRFRIAALLVALQVAGAGAEARAQTTQQTTAVAAAAVFGAIDLFFFAYDLVLSERGQPPAPIAVYLETVAATLQLAVGLSMLGVSLQTDKRVAELGIDRDLYVPIGVLMAALSAPLLVHGIRSSSRRGSGMHTLRVAPIVVGDVYASGPGIAIAGVF